MSKEIQFVKGAEIKIKGPRVLDPVLMYFAAAGLIAYDTFRHPLTYSLLVRDYNNRTIFIEREKKGLSNG